ncbi:hypothetical protein EYF80_012955 [Liparis tanakae]|uniref:Uncharacterized protein n=1 Tax=Liparis tanakae TaxID=230148 RepID=A0A4Z2IHV1_9TELE|nr:hypothetical protein EYF80_012955 [Liparis tanakae]
MVTFTEKATLRPNTSMKSTERINTGSSLNSLQEHSMPMLSLYPPSVPLPASCSAGAPPGTVTSGDAAVQLLSFVRGCTHVPLG